MMKNGSKSFLQFLPFSSMVSPKYCLFLFHVYRCFVACLPEAPCMYVSAGQKRASEPLGLELYLGADIWVLGLEPVTSGKSASALNH